MDSTAVTYRAYNMMSHNINSHKSTPLTKMRSTVFSLQELTEKLKKMEMVVEIFDHAMT